VMPSHHLSCAACLIRLRADSPAIAVLEDRCPICGAALTAVTSASEIVGYRSFDLDVLSGGGSDDLPDSLVPPVDLLSHMQAGGAHDAEDAGRWLDDGGSTASNALAPR
jgi:hypothetical protein